ncbi:Soluble guanylate cyclase 88E, partial [Tetrabaena socialis]
KGDNAIAQQFDCVTILFSDIVGYTTVASKLTPFQVVTLLNELFTVFDELTARNGVYKVETIGDSLMCVAGCPIAEAGPRTAQRIANMALDMVRAVEAFRPSLPDVRLQIRVGVHSGNGAPEGGAAAAAAAATVAAAAAAAAAGTGAATAATAAAGGGDASAEGTGGLSSRPEVFGVVDDEQRRQAALTVWDALVLPGTHARMRRAVHICTARVASVTAAWSRSAGNDCAQTWTHPGHTLLPQVSGAILRERPSMAAAAALVFVVLCGAGLAGVLVASANAVSKAQDLAANGVGAQVAQSLREALLISTFGSELLCALVVQMPQCAWIEENWGRIGADIMRRVDPTVVQQLELDVAAVIWKTHPPLEGQIADLLYGKDLLGGTDRTGTMYLLQQRRTLILGPYNCAAGFKCAFTVTPVFLPAPTYEYDWGCGFQPYNCTDLCWDPVKKIKFWGQVSTMLNLDQFLASSAEDARLVILRNRGYLFKLWQEETSDSNPYVVLANSSRLPVHPVTQSIAVYNLVWHLELAPEGGWVPSWRDPCIAAVVVGSTLVSLLVLWLLMSKEQHNSLLREMLPKKVIRQLQKGDNAIAQQFDCVTILFSDIVGYTTVASKLTPFQVRHLIRGTPGRAVPATTAPDRPGHTLLPQVTGAILMERPSIGAAAALVFVVLCGAGLAGVLVASANAVAKAEDLAANGVGAQVAQSLREALLIATFGSELMCAVVAQMPTCPALEESWGRIGADIMARVDPTVVQQLELVPAGIIWKTDPVLTGPLADFLYGRDLLRVPSERTAVIYLLQQRRTIIHGPYKCAEGFNCAFTISPIFLPAPTYEYDWGCGFQPYNCTDLCWDPVNKIKFWGQVSTMLNLDTFLSGSDPRLVILRKRGYLFRLWQEETSSINPFFVLANSSVLPVRPVTLTIEIYNMVWSAVHSATHDGAAADVSPTPAASQASADGGGPKSKVSGAQRNARRTLDLGPPRTCHRPPLPPKRRLTAAAPNPRVPSFKKPAAPGAWLGMCGYFNPL